MRVLAEDLSYHWNVPLNVSVEDLTFLWDVPIELSFLWDLPYVHPEQISHLRHRRPSQARRQKGRDHHLQVRDGINSQYSTIARPSAEGTAVDPAYSRPAIQVSIPPLTTSPTHVRHLLDSSPSSDMPPWREDAEQRVREWVDAYHTAVGHVRLADNCTGLLYICHGPPALVERFLLLPERRYPCLSLPGEEGQLIVFLTGDPKAVHEVIAMDIFEEIRDANLHLLRDMRQEYKFTGSPDLRVNVREHGAIGGRQFVTGWATKEPDAVSWRKGQIEEDNDAVIEIAYNNEKRAELLWECRLWSQQGQHPTPVIMPRNVLGIKIENAPSYRQDATVPAMAVLMFWAADPQGVGAYTVTLLNAAPAYAAIWREETGLEPLLAEEVQVPFSFFLRGHPQQWDTNDIVLSTEWLASSFADGEAKERQQEVRAVRSS
ncbi:unnamed protein product [Sympodiomycopsis kandeliae]